MPLSIHVKIELLRRKLVQTMNVPNLIDSYKKLHLDQLIEDENSMRTSMPNMPSTFDNDI